MGGERNTFHHPRPAADPSAVEHGRSNRDGSISSSCCFSSLFSLSLLVFLFSSWRKVVGLWLTVCTCSWLHVRYAVLFFQQREKRKKNPDRIVKTIPFLSLSLSILLLLSLSVYLFPPGKRRKIKGRRMGRPFFFSIYFFFLLYSAQFRSPNIYILLPSLQQPLSSLHRLLLLLPVYSLA